MTRIDAPFSLRHLQLPSRLVRSATAEHVLPERPGGPEKLAHIYRALGQGGVGLIVTGHVAVHPTGPFNPLMPGCWSDAQEEGWQAAFAAAHETPAKICMQINHAGGRAHEKAIQRPPWCVSRIDAKKDPMLGEELDEERIAELIEAFATAAERAVRAGADAIQLHAAHGYLVSQFLSPRTNKRTDRWGGDLEGRSRFLFEIARAVRRRLGPEAVVGIKLGAADDPEGDGPGLTLEESLEIARELEEVPLDFLEVSGGFHSEIVRRRIRRREDEAYFLPWARQFKEVLSIPIACVGGFRTIEVVEDALASGACDLVSMSRPLIREPDLLSRLVAGRGVACVSDNRCMLRRNEALHCPVERKEAEKRTERESQE